LQLTVSGRHVAVTDAMREHARERVGRLDRMGSHLTRVAVTLSIEGERHMAEIVGKVRRRGEIVARHESHDMYLSIDQAAEKFEKQLRKMEARFKTRRESPRESES